MAATSLKVSIIGQKGMSTDFVVNLEKTMTITVVRVLNQRISFEVALAKVKLD